MSERRKWWDDSKRMEKGILLCLLVVDGGKSFLLFFTVSEKITDPKEKHGLVSDNHQAIIIVKLATESQRDLELMARLSCQNLKGLLVEFPDVIIATFLPILENIQNMQRSGRLPFSQWIIPDRVPDTEHQFRTTAIPLPLYARHPGFDFPLTTISRDSAEKISMAATVSVEDEDVVNQLEARTWLDRGQCVALIAALSREFALIQGPPGTGKSYLGVQLMRVLLSCKLKADLGPIFVV